ncbi:MAG: LEPR-XLL domain-containing protein [Phycisphaerales bacterium]|nr:LEPR-XLL domain-containing protein [Phycisphaerales bacterium]
MPKSDLPEPSVSQNPPPTPDAPRSPRPSQPRGQVDALEPRILLSATWIGTDADDTTDDGDTGSDLPDGELPVLGDDGSAPLFDDGVDEAGQGEGAEGDADDPDDAGSDAGLPPERVEWIHSLNYSQFNQLTAEESPYLTTQQVGSIPNSYEFSRMSVEARAALAPEQVQALQVDKVSIGYLTGAQVGHLTTDQIEDLRWSDFRFLSVNEVDDLTPEQIATIPNSYEFSRMSVEARAALAPEQVQALQVDKVSIGYLTGAGGAPDDGPDRGPARWSDFRFLSVNEVDDLTPEQIATIPNSYEFSRMSVERGRRCRRSRCRRCRWTRSVSGT